MATPYLGPFDAASPVMHHAVQSALDWTDTEAASLEMRQVPRVALAPILTAFAQIYQRHTSNEEIGKIRHA